MSNDRIEIDPKKCHGRPVIRGTRVPVAIVTGSVAGGMSLEDVACEYDLPIDDVRAAIACATAAVESKPNGLIGG